MAVTWAIIIEGRSESEADFERDHSNHHGVTRRKSLPLTVNRELPAT
jgi:hypothetical protein